MRLGVALVLVGVGLVVAAPAADAAKRKPCSMPGSHTVRRDAGGRIFVVTKGHRYSEDWTWYGCLFRTGKRVRIVNPSEDAVNAADHFLLRSPYAAYMTHDSASGSVLQDVHVINLKSGARNTYAASFSQPQGFGTQLVRLILTQHGAIVWTEVTYGSNATGSYSDYRVEMNDWAAGPAELDRGPDIDPRSLAVTPSGRRAYWTNAGEPRSAVLR